MDRARLFSIEVGADGDFQWPIFLRDAVKMDSQGEHRFQDLLGCFNVINAAFFRWFGKLF